MKSHLSRSDSSRRSFLRNSFLATAGLALPPFPWANQYADYIYFSIAEISMLLRQRKVSPVEITKACLLRIEQLNHKLNAFITVMAEQALLEASQAEAEMKQGKWKGPLHGVPIALKDNIDTAAIRTTAASGVYQDRIPPQDAEVVTRLKKAGAIVLGKLNMHEFANGTTSAVSFFGSVHNPWNTDYIAGGSSGGSAAAVAAGLCYAALGTDTAGSIRLPAASCGVTGLKPTADLIPIRGIIPLATSLDHAGPLCRSVEDAALLLNVLARPAAPPAPCKVDYQQFFNSIPSSTIGIIQNYKASEEVKASFQKAIATFQALGYKTTEIELPPIPPSFWVILSAEVAAYHEPLVKQFKERYDPATLSLISTSKLTNSVEYINARKEMAENRSSISERLFKNNAVLILPTTTSVPLTLAEAKKRGPVALAIDNTYPFNYYGLPAISIPCGFSQNGLPLGLQMVGPVWGEPKVLAIAHQYQKATSWHLKHP
jgi:aspartyl-tRNA(Asn)/glutamyl-tRNA(Gln) amidotransferase subunit A